MKSIIVKCVAMLIGKLSSKRIGIKLLSEFKSLQNKIEKDKDPFMFVHFSREEDHFNGITSNEMDSGDAIIILKYLLNRFDINILALL